MFPERSRFLHIEFHFAFQFEWIARPNDRVACGVVQRKECRDVGRPGEVQETRRRTVILHQSEPLEVVVAIWRMRKKMGGLPLEDAKDALFLIRPGARVDSVRQ